MYNNLSQSALPFPETQPAIFTKLNRVFAGREKELRQMTNFLEQARLGNGNFVIISGEAGTGKSRLIKEFVRLARQHTSLIAREDFDSTNYYQPYHPFWQLIKRLEELTHYHLDREVREQLEHQENIISSGTETLLSLPTDNNLLQQRLVTHLLQIAKDQVVILVLKNIHNASPATWRFIHYLSESIIESKILMVLTLRLDGRIKDSNKIPKYAEILKRMNRERLIHRIDLKRFTTPQIRNLVYQIFQRSDFSNSFIPILEELSGGLPATLLEYLNSFIRHGIVYQETGIWVNREDISEEKLLPLLRQSNSSFNFEVYETKFTEDQRTLLQYAALFDRRVDYRILADLLHKPKIALVKDLENLRDYKLFYELGGGYYKFRQRRFQLRVRKFIDRKRFQVMHLEIAKAIENADHLTPSEKIHLLAYHYSQTMQYEKALSFLLQAGDLALRNFAFSEAKHFFTTAHSILPQFDIEQQKKKKLPIVLKLAWLTKVLGDRKKSLELYCQALQLSEQMGEKQYVGEILVHKGLTHVQLNDYQSAIANFRKVLSDNPVHTNHKLKTLAYIGMGNIYFEQSEYEKALSHYQTALDLAQATNDQTNQANILNNMGVVQSILGNRVGAIALYSQSIPIYKITGDNYGLARVYNNIGITYADEGNWKQANAFYGKSLSVSDVMGLVPLKSTTFLNRAIALIHLKRLEEAEEYILKARRLLDRLHDEVGIAECYRIQGMMYRVKGNHSGAQEHLFTSLKKFNKVNNPLGIAETQYELGLLFASLQDYGQVEEWLYNARDTFIKMGLMEKVQEITARLESITPQ